MLLENDHYSERLHKLLNETLPLCCLEAAFSIISFSCCTIGCLFQMLKQLYVFDTFIIRFHPLWMTSLKVFSWVLRQYIVYLLTTAFVTKIFQEKNSNSFCGFQFVKKLRWFLLESVMANCKRFLGKQSLSDNS